jgi:hypothetical protein
MRQNMSGLAKMARVIVVVISLSCLSELSYAIDVKLDDAAIKSAIEAGKQVKDVKSMPTPRFGADLSKDLCGGGGEIRTKTFTLQRLGAVIAADPERFEREKDQAQHAIEKAAEAKDLKITFDFCGDTADFAEDAQATLEQDGRMIKGEMAKPDKARKNPEGPAYRGKITASFAYGSFDPVAPTKITLYPKIGDAMTWDVDLSTIK